MTLHWAIGDLPETHPMWEQQLALEKGMLQEGADKVKDIVAIATQKKKMSRLAPMRALITEWLPIVANGITEWTADATASRGPKPIALPHIKSADPYVAALITLRSILDGIMTGRTHVAAVGSHIGSYLEHELQVRKWEESERKEYLATPKSERKPGLFAATARMLERDGATSDHRALVNINRFNHHHREGNLSFDWVSWDQDTKFRVGATLIDVLMRHTSWFECIYDPEHKPRHFRDPRLVIAARPGLVAYVGQALDSQELTPVFKPTLMPPKRWSGIRHGGYYTPYMPTPRLIRFKASQESQKTAAADEYDALDMPATYRALHLLQEVPWTVNARVLDVAVKAYALSKPRGTKDNTGIGGLPLVDQEELPPRTGAHQEFLDRHREAKRGRADIPAASEELEAEMRAWRRKAKRVKGRNSKKASTLRHTSTTIQMAQAFRGKEFYFPHMLDFRGRFYPIPSALQPQGNDIARGLLTFANGIAITAENEGAGWLAMHVANTWGNDKISLDARIAWTHKNESLWRRIAASPLDCLDWSTCDKPFQALAAIFEWVAYLDHGEGYISALPIMVDGSCNGIQHLAALTLDEVAGAQVNLVPGAKPSDIYAEVARRLQKRIGQSGSEHADYWMALTGGDLPRTLTKRQTMVLPYGGTRDACFEYTRKWLDEADPADPDSMSPEDWRLRSKRIGFLVDHMWAVLKEVVSGGVKVMKWLQACSRETMMANQPLFWMTPAGFVVRHFYGHQKLKQIKTKLDGQVHQIVLAQTTDKLDVKKQTTGVPPNFIHSLDAAALTACLDEALTLGLTDITAVHDAYGTHAANMWSLSHLIRSSFAAIHRQDPLGAFRKACAGVLVDYLMYHDKLSQEQAAAEAEKRLPPVPAMGSLCLDDVIHSDYFFA